jgi:hypothetical protein
MRQKYIFNRFSVLQRHDTSSENHLQMRLMHEIADFSYSFRVVELWCSVKRELFVKIYIIIIN